MYLTGVSLAYVRAYPCGISHVPPVPCAILDAGAANVALTVWLDSSRVGVGVVVRVNVT